MTNTAIKLWEDLQKMDDMDAYDLRQLAARLVKADRHYFEREINRVLTRLEQLTGEPRMNLRVQAHKDAIQMEANER